MVNDAQADGQGFTRMTESAVLTEAMEDYLEAIYHLLRKREVVRVKDIAEDLGVTMPSVSSALKSLTERELVNHEKYGHVTLTEAGRKRAELVHRRHQGLTCFLRDILQRDPEVAEAEACRLEHALSNETLRRMLAMIEFIKRCPRGGEEWLEHLSGRWDYVPCDHECADCVAGIDVPDRNPFAAREPTDVSVTLRDIDPGDKCRVLRLSGKSAVRRRIMDMGVIPGCEVEVERLAPLGDPIEIKVRDYHLSLRKEEAAQIAVERI